MKAICRVSRCGGATARGKGFTLVELLVILGVVALLGTLQLSARASATRRTKEAMCASNLRQVTLALYIYGGENGDKLPSFGSFLGNWAWDMPWSVGDALLACNLQKRSFYCPGTAPRFTDADNFLDSSSLWNWGQPSFHVVGYVLAFSGSYSVLILSNQNTTLQPEPIRLSYSVTTNPPPNAERVLVADATISDSYSDTYANAIQGTCNFTSVWGGFPKAHITPHLKGSIPAGGNLGFKDGHVAWRKFDGNPHMDQRATRNAGFWW